MDEVPDYFATPPDKVTHADMWRAIAEIGRRQDRISTEAALQVQVQQRIENQLKEISKSIGKETEDEKGVKFGTGLNGRVLRLEQRFGLIFDKWLNRIIGIAGAAAILGAIIWYLAEPRIAHIFRP